VDRADILKNMTLAGIILTVLSFTLYILKPNNSYIVMFAVGIALMVIGYVAGSRDEDRVTSELMHLRSLREDLGSPIISLDGPYAPYEDCGPIESLEDL
jgi:hypothetical protein